MIGASRGIGRQIALSLSKAGFNVGVAAKTAEPNPKLPGTIYSVVEEIKQQGGRALALPCNVRVDEQIKETVNQTLKQFGSLDFVVYNAGAVKWAQVIDVSMKDFDLLQSVNIRGCYATIQEVLPHMLAQKRGRILIVSPPIYSRFFRGKTSYAIGKVGMTVLVHGLANELVNTGVAISALWPATTIESFVTEKYQVDPRTFRKADIFADACVELANESPDKFNGDALIDEDYLRIKGYKDFTKYRVIADTEPPRALPKRFPSLRVEEEEDYKAKL